MMEIHREDIKNKGIFYVEENGERLAELAYSKAGPDTITVYHTEVNEKLRGEGIGQDLVKAVVEYARKNNFKIIPQCPYAKKIIDRTPEFHDVLA